MILEIVIVKKKFCIELTNLSKLILLAGRFNYDLLPTLRSSQKNNPLSNFLFPKIPNYLLPTQLEFFILSKEDLGPEVFDIKKWKFNMADFDIF